MMHAWRSTLAVRAQKSQSLWAANKGNDYIYNLFTKIPPLS